MDGVQAFVDLLGERLPGFDRCGTVPISFFTVLLALADRSAMLLGVLPGEEDSDEADNGNDNTASSGDEGNGLRVGKGNHLKLLRRVRMV